MCYSIWKTRWDVFSPCSVLQYQYVLNCVIVFPCLRQDTASLGSQKGGISKHGWLYKGNMNSAISVTMRVRQTVVMATYRTKIISKLFN